MEIAQNTQSERRGINSNNQSNIKSAAMSIIGPNNQS